MFLENFVLLKKFFYNNQSECAIITTHFGTSDLGTYGMCNDH